MHWQINAMWWVLTVLGCMAAQQQGILRTRAVGRK